MAIKNDTFHATFPYMEGGYPEENLLVVHADSSQSTDAILTSGEAGFFKADETGRAIGWLIEHGCDEAVARDLVTTAREELVRVQVFADGSQRKSASRKPCRTDHAENKD